ncbi:MAG TPA: CDP-diacylglycerol--glycerol-3-phosphate 3-phosphatidyltransferase [Rhodothermales bacterium]|nr:CDP-diacylglycerol--glycerol-3-phosphate 3-phosphatidyltransferase [Rhodothermales bacterium]
MKHLPNSLTIARILLTPVFLMFILVDTFLAQLLALGVFMLAAVSDWLDGLVARRFDADSELGRYLDPFADKVLVLSAFVVLPFLLPSVVPWWAVIVIAVRDVIITGLRIFASYKNRPLKTLPLAKTKTASQLTFLIVVIGLLVVRRAPEARGLNQFASDALESDFVYFFLLVVVLLTAVTGIMYFLRQPANEPVST